MFQFSNSLCLALNILDFEYFKFTLKRSTADLFDLLAVGNDIQMQGIYLATQHWYLIFILPLFIGISEWLYRKTEKGSRPTQSNLVVQSLASLAAIAVLTICSRGGLGLKPLSIIEAGKYAEAKNIPLVLNTPFTVMKTIFNQGLEEVQSFSEEEAITYFNPVQQFTDDSVMRKTNVVVIILESFSKEYVGALNKELGIKGFTPFLDSLIDQSLVFSNCFANGRKSIEGIPAVVAGLPSLMNNPYISSNYASNEINSLANLLGVEDYHTSFFHGGINGTMGFDGFTKTVGFQHYFGKNEYPFEEHYDGNWGIFDEEYFQYFAEKLTEFKKPFFSCILSLSSHHPYTIPEKYRDKFKGGEFNIHKTVQYTDFALQQFFNSVNKTDWFENTLFVLTADHSAMVNHPQYKTNKGIYAIPLIFYQPGSKLKGIDETITQQADIMPSVLHYIGYQKPFIAFGQSVFDKNSDGFAVSFLNNIHQIIDKNYLLQFDGMEIIAAYNYNNDPLLKNNVLSSPSEEAQELENKLKAIIQNYNNRLINNQLVAIR